VTLRLPGIKVLGLAGVDGQRQRGPSRIRAMFLYGVSYAITSLGCAIAPFLAVVASTFRSGDLLRGVASYAAYAFGMGMVITVFALATVFAGGSSAGVVRRLAPYTARAGGVLLAAVGAYIAWFGAYELRVHAGGDPNDPVVLAGAALQSALVHLIGNLGPAGIALFLALVIATTVAVGRRNRSRASR
jgi:cytochrome c-type biogenesis protein